MARMLAKTKPMHSFSRLTEFLNGAPAVESSAEEGCKGRSRTLDPALFPLLRVPSSTGCRNEDTQRALRVCVGLACSAAIYSAITYRNDWPSTRPPLGCGELASRQLDCKCVCGAMVFTSIEHAPVCGGKVKPLRQACEGNRLLRRMTDDREPDRYSR